MKKIINKVLVALLVTSFALTGCSKPVEDPAAKPAETKTEEVKEPEAAAPVEKKNIKFYGKVVEYTSGPKMTDALIEKMKDKYNIEAIQVDWANMDKVIRTGIASGDPCDIYNYPPSNMASFKDMAVDLTPYLDADPEWKAQFEPAALAAGTVDGKILSIPWESNFTVVLANKKMLDDLGIQIPETWNLEEFTAVCKKIQDADLFPFANATDLGRASWMYRNAMLSTTVSSGKYEDFTKGLLPLNGPEAKEALVGVKSLYDQKFMYPGEGAVTVKNDEIKAAFYQGKIAMMAEIAAGAKVTAKDAGFEVVPVPWPSMGKEGAINGGYNGFFIPQNSKNIEDAVEVLKAFTSPEIQALHATDGYIPANKNVEITDEFVKGIVAQAATLRSPEDPAYTAMDDYRNNMLIPELMLGGGVEDVMKKLEEFRQKGQVKK